MEIELQLVDKLLKIGGVKGDDIFGNTVPHVRLSTVDCFQDAYTQGA